MEFTTDESKLTPPSGTAGTEPRPTAKPRPKPLTTPESAEAGATGHLLGADGLGADGRELPEAPPGALSQLSAPLLDFAERNPKGAALLSLGVGLVAGAILGVAIKRD